MQKLLTIAIDTTQLNTGKLTPFEVTEITEINEHLELGWQLEEWDFIKEGETDGQVVLMIVLNDDTMYENQEDDFDTEFQADGDFDEEDEEESSLKSKG